MAESVKIDFNIWSHFDHHVYEIMTDDFVHDELFKIDANILADNGKIRFQNAISQSKKPAIQVLTETNILFSVSKNKFLYLQLRDKGFRLHFDNGVIFRNHLRHNLYASFESSRSLSNHLFKIGCETISEKSRFNLRYRYSTLENNHTIYSRWRYDYENWTFQGIEAFNINDFNFIKNNILIGYYFGSKTLHLRLENKDWKLKPINLSSSFSLKDIFDCATLNFTQTLNENSRFGLEIPISTAGVFNKCSFVWQAYENSYNSTLKLKWCMNSSFAISIRNRLGVFGSYILGAGIDKIGSDNLFKYGIKLNLNI